MSAIPTPASRFRECRERAGLSHEAAAERLGISSAAVWDIETHVDELASSYSLIDLQKFAHVFGVRPEAFFGAETLESMVSAADLVQLIRERCQQRRLTIEELETKVGWHLSSSLGQPDRLLPEITVDGLRWLCEELGIHWHRVLLGL